MSRYDYPVYVVIPLGDAEENATDEDIQAVRDGLHFFVSHAITDPDLCDTITQHLLARLGTL